MNDPNPPPDPPGAAGQGRKDGACANMVKSGSENDPHPGRTRQAKTRSGRRLFPSRIAFRLLPHSAATSAGAMPGPFAVFYENLLTKGIQPAMARLTLARKIAAIALCVWKKGEPFNAEYVKPQAA